jgi:glutamate transport system permease protein
MRNLINFHGSDILLIFAIFAFGFLCLTLPMGLLSSWAAKRYRVAR